MKRLFSLQKTLLDVRDKRMRYCYLLYPFSITSELTSLREHREMNQAIQAIKASHASKHARQISSLTRLLSVYQILCLGVSLGGTDHGRQKA